MEKDNWFLHHHQEFGLYLVAMILVNSHISITFLSPIFSAEYTFIIRLLLRVGFSKYKNKLKTLHRGRKMTVLSVLLYVESYMKIM